VAVKIKAKKMLKILLPLAKEQLSTVRNNMGYLPIHEAVKQKAQKVFDLICNYMQVQTLLLPVGTQYTVCTHANIEMFQDTLSLACQHGQFRMA
jgi:hypothetical protein